MSINADMLVKQSGKVQFFFSSILCGYHVQSGIVDDEQQKAKEALKTTHVCSKKTGLAVTVHSCMQRLVKEKPRIVHHTHHATEN